MNAKFVCKGDVVFSIDQEHMQSIEQGFVVCEDGICMGAYDDCLQNMPSIRWWIAGRT